MNQSVLFVSFSKKQVSCQNFISSIHPPLELDTNKPNKKKSLLFFLGFKNKPLEFNEG